MLRVFFGASFFVFAAQMLRFLAPLAGAGGDRHRARAHEQRLHADPLLVVNRRLEFITLRVVIGIVTSVTGALILVAALAV